MMMTHRLPKITGTRFLIKRVSKIQFVLYGNEKAILVSDQNSIWKVVGKLMMDEYQSGLQPVCSFPSDIGPLAKR